MIFYLIVDHDGGEDEDDGEGSEGRGEGSEAKESRRVLPIERSKGSGSCSRGCGGCGASSRDNSSTRG